MLRKSRGRAGKILRWDRVENSVYIFFSLTSLYMVAWLGEAGWDWVGLGFSVIFGFCMKFRGEARRGQH